MKVQALAVAAPGSRHLADCGKAAPAPTSKEEEEDESSGCLRCQRRPLSAGTSHALSPHGRVSVWTLAAVAGPQRAARNEVILRTGGEFEDGQGFVWQRFTV